MVPRIDLTDIAAFYKLPFVPKVVFDMGDELQAAFRGMDRKIIHAGTGIFHATSDKESKERFKALGLRNMSPEDGAKFIIAHEVSHLVDWELNQEQYRSDALMQFFGEDVLGVDIPHEKYPAEKRADHFAAKTYQLVHISYPRRIDSKLLDALQNPVGRILRSSWK